MLHAYSVAAIADNWLHECIGEVLHRIHADLADGGTTPEWPMIVPQRFRSRLKTRRGLGDYLKKYTLAVGGLNPEEREQIIRAFDDENQISRLLACACNCVTVDDLPGAIRAPIADLFEYLFGLLTELGIRDDAYRAIYQAEPDHVCAFCGLEYFEAPGGKREAFDHYLLRNRYPFAAANLRNLVPMGHKCNSSYKLVQDILRNLDGTRRRSFDPYGAITGIRISLVNSEPFAGADGQTPAWTIDFEPEGEEATTWDEVFRIRERYRRDVLDADFKRWLEDFGRWCRRQHADLNGEDDLLSALQGFAEDHEEMGLRERAFLKASMFRMLLRHCQDGHERLKQLLRGMNW